MSQKWEDGYECAFENPLHTTVYDQGGVDSWAEIIADELGINKEIYPAPARQWSDRIVTTSTDGTIIAKALGYKSRNIQIAEASDVLYVLSPKCYQCDGTGHMETRECDICLGSGRIWNGGEWTGNYAEKFDKKVVRIAL